MFQICTPLKTPKPPKIVPAALDESGNNFGGNVQIKTRSGPEVGESAVCFGHLVGVFAFFHSLAFAF
jgi:hypothetical protein